MSPGDKVVVVDPPSFGNVKEGQIYTVKKAFPSHISLEEMKPASGLWYKNRFVLLSSLSRAERVLLGVSDDA